jgi:protein-tyrosine-phosphatase
LAADPPFQAGAVKFDNEVKMPSVLFVCTADRFRSPFAAALFRHRLGQEADGQDWSIGSAGTWADSNKLVIPPMKRIAGHLHLDLSAHKSRRINRDLLHSYDLILVMESNQREALLVEFPEIENRLFLLSEVTIDRAYDIPDPHAQPGNTFEDVATELQDLIDRGYKNIYDLAFRLHDDRVM